MKTNTHSQDIGPISFLSIYLLTTAIGAAIYAVGWQYAFDRGHAPSDTGWLGTIVLLALAAMFNLCGLNQILIVLACLLRTVRRALGLKFAASAGLVFSIVPLAIKEGLRQSRHFQVGILNESLGEYAASWGIAAALFASLGWLVSLERKEKTTESNNALDRKG